MKTKKNNNIIVAGVDEAGRGPLAGPVYAAAVILDPRRRINGLNDSKLLTEKKREELAKKIRGKALAYCVAFATVEEIETLNIFHASMLAMKRAIEGLSIVPQQILVDGTHYPTLNFECERQAIIKGDQLIPAISAASILAKVARDHEMVRLDEEYPSYGFAQHKGYTTDLHITQLAKLGPCEIHRKTFARLKEHRMVQTDLDKFPPASGEGAKKK